VTIDPKTFRLAVVFLGFAFLACIVGIIVLAGLHDAIPSALDTLPGVAGGALAGLFVTPHNDEPTPVTTAPDHPLEVTPAPPNRRRARDGGFYLLELLVWLVVAAIVVAVILAAMHTH
jgi:hypothetical protein